jgi:hypothetical protein
MKKLFAFIAALLVLSCVVFADVSVKDLGGGNAEVTFFYGNPKATEVVVAGSWTDWQNGAIPMTKVEKGWEYKTTVPYATEMKYKFISDGNWTTDLKAPDFVDDGFGGKNGYVDVASLIAASKAAATGAAVEAPKKANVKFQTWSMFGFQSKFNTVDKFELATAGVNAKSYWKFGGEALPGVPVYVEIALAEQDSFSNLYNKDVLEFKDGIKNLVTDTVFDPVYFYGGQEAAKTYLGHFKTGITTKYVEWTTGYKYAKLTAHKNVSWDTVDQDWEAGYNSTGGFSAFKLGEAFRQIGDITLNATIAPNRSADRAGSQYGMYAFVNAQYGKHYVDFQYNGAYGTTYDTIFDEVYESDFIAGYKGDFGPVAVKLNALYNIYGANIVNDEYKTVYNPASSDVTGAVEDGDFLQNFATNVQATYASDLITATLGYRARGDQANMMYIEDGNADDHTHIADQLGDVNTQRVWIDLSVTPIEALTLGLNPYVNMAFDKDSAKQAYTNVDNMLVYVKPSFSFKASDLITVDGYAKAKYATEKDDQFTRGDDQSQFVLPEAGLKLTVGGLNDVIKGAEVCYGFDNNEDAVVFHTVIGSVKLPSDIGAQAGFGLRNDNAGNDIDGAFGLFVGANKKLSVLAKPILYTQFVFNMDPYKAFGDGQENFNLDGYTIDSDVNNYQGAAAFRVALRWDL